MITNRRDVLDTVRRVNAIEREVPLRDRLTPIDDAADEIARAVYGRAVLACFKSQADVTDKVIAILRSSPVVRYYEIETDEMHGVRGSFNLSVAGVDLGTASNGGDYATASFGINAGQRAIAALGANNALQTRRTRFSKNRQPKPPTQSMDFLASGTDILPHIASDKVQHVEATLGYGGEHDNRGITPHVMIARYALDRTDARSKCTSERITAPSPYTKHVSFSQEEYDALIGLNSVADMALQRAYTVDAITEYYS